MNQTELMREHLREILAYCEQLGYELGTVGLEAKQTLAAQPEFIFKENTGRGVKEVLRIEADGEVIWRGRKVETDDEFRAAMVELNSSMRKLAAEPVQGEPVAWAATFDDGQICELFEDRETLKLWMASDDCMWDVNIKPLYPQPTPPVRLTLDDILKVYKRSEKLHGTKFCLEGMEPFFNLLMDAMERVNRRQLDQTPNSPSE